MQRRGKIALSLLGAAGLVYGAMASASALPWQAPSGNDPAGGSRGMRALIAPSVSEASFVPVSPCRIADTRKAGGALQVGASRAFTVRGTTQFVPQGGTSGGCGIPAGASSVSVSISSVDSSGSGFIRAYPTGGSPDATVLNYQRGQDISVTSTIKLASNATAKPLTLRAYGSATQVTLDVVGYFAPPMTGFVEEDGTLSQSTGRVLSSSRTGAGLYSVTFDRSLKGCSVLASPYGFNYVVATERTSGSTVDIYIHTEDAPDVYQDTSFHIAAFC